MKKKLLFVFLILIIVLGYFAYTHKPILNTSDDVNRSLKSQPAKSDENVSLPEGTLFTINTIPYTADIFPKEYQELPQQQQQAFVSRYLYYKLLLESLAKEEKTYQKLIEYAVQQYHKERKRKGLHKDVLQGVLDQQKISLDTIVKEEVVKKHTNIDQDITDSYNKFKKDFYYPDRVEVSFIILKTEEEAIEILKELDQNNTLEKFTELAEKHTLYKKTKFNGGYIGEVGEKFGKELFQMMWSAKKNSIMPQPLKYKDQYYIVYVFDQLKAEQRSLDQEKENIKDFLLKDDIKTWKRERFKQLKQENDVKFYGIKL